MTVSDPRVLVRERLIAAADPDKALPMAAYLKTDMAFYGVQKPGRVPIQRELVRSFPPQDHADYVSTVAALWAMSHREEKYIALGYAGAFDRYIEPESVALYRTLIVEGAWWDFVDEIATKLVGRAIEKDRAAVTPVVRSWIRDDDLWIRRVSIICQLKHKSATDTELLNDACLANIDDPEFFIRKAIGWALRQYASTDPEWVLGFVALHRNQLSALSYREATKHL